MRILFISIFIINFLVAQAGNFTKESNRTLAEIKRAKEIQLLLKTLKEIDKVENEKNLWQKIYSSYKAYQKLQKVQENLQRRIYELRGRYNLTKEQKEELSKLESQYQVNMEKLQLLKEFQKDPFKKLLEPPKIENPPEVGNPFSIITAFSYLRKLSSEQKNYEENFKKLKDTIAILNQKKEILEKLSKYNSEFKEKLKDINKELLALKPIEEIFKTTKDIYNKKVDEIRVRLEEDIKREIQKTALIVGVILFFFILFLFLKYIVGKYLGDKESFYTVNKVLNIIFISVAIIVLLFAYIENVNYLVTILGFASAGIAIAMKDWFMSLMGWFVIVFGGAIHVGDRIKVIKDGAEYVGDVIDISLLRITIQEDVTLTTYMHNRRAGRIFFVPNNYIFTDVIANYSHSGLKTVWDGIDIMITFDSNISKAASIAKDIAKKYSKGYTEITRKQLNKLRRSYHLKNTNVEPRIYTFIEEYGVKVSVWYLTNAFATLTLRSTISYEILEKFLNESDIKIAYPTDKIYLSKEDPLELINKREKVSE